jgi:hypothetical protein
MLDDISFSEISDFTRQCSPLFDEEKEKMKHTIKVLELRVKLLEENFGSLEEKITSLENEKDSKNSFYPEDDDRYAIDFPDMSTSQLVFSGWRPKKRSRTKNK